LAVMSEKSGLIGCTDPGMGVFYYMINEQGTLDYKTLASGTTQNLLRPYHSR